MNCYETRPEGQTKEEIRKNVNDILDIIEALKVALSSFKLISRLRPHDVRYKKAIESIEREKARYEQLLIIIRKENV